MDDAWICGRLGEDEPWALGAVNPPIFENSLFTFAGMAELGEAIRNEDERYVYWRGTNPTVDLAQRKLAALERAERAKCFASGMGAISATISSLVSAGDHVLVLGAVYGPTTQFLRYLEKFGVTHTHVADLGACDSAVKENTRLLYFESPSYMRYEIFDIPAVARWAAGRGLVTVMDNTWSTPIFQKPLTMGVDLVVHSLSKYAGGHSDLVGGVVAGPSRLIRPLALTEYQLYGAAMSPHDAAKVIRGLRTLPVRMAAHQERGLAVAAFLEGHPAVRRVNHPGLPSHPGHRVAKGQMSGFSSLFSFELDTESREEVAAVVDELRHFRVGVSWGGFESLVNAPALSVEESVRATMGVPVGLVRLSVGLEPAATLIEDLAGALARVA
ncbi:PLP-dependent aspartate aminotransferase family protein [Nonomuraea sp. MCN248]|uniref:PLP-dependent aspartate aminotransferase family protein n=1 Tax=Nonomuraea corallina TaxID=2989783 RepID=A0ABT4S7E3_9ACTN|nr:PLP-dependent aspartate aminotransferase family protein [Nonomuraea corallina]MDA0633118.1 PLP-dependent aspartate aminotransferase family protein [Nonomuraea corallina]